MRGQKGENHAHICQVSRTKFLVLLKLISIFQFPVGYGCWGRQGSFPAWTRQCSLLRWKNNKFHLVFMGWHQTPLPEPGGGFAMNPNNSLTPLHLSQALHMEFKNSISSFMGRIRSELVQTAGNHQPPTHNSLKNKCALLPQIWRRKGDPILSFLPFLSNPHHWLHTCWMYFDVPTSSENVIFDNALK